MGNRHASLIDGIDFRVIFIEARGQSEKALFLITDILHDLIIAEIQKEGNLLDVSDAEKVSNGWTLVFEGKLIHLATESNEISCDHRYPINVVSKIFIESKNGFKQEAFKKKILEFAHSFTFQQLITLSWDKLKENERTLLCKDISRIFKLID